MHAPFHLSFCTSLALALSITGALPCRAAEEGLYSIGAAKVDITPDYPIRLSGYGGRERESEGVDQRIFARALAIRTDRQGPAVLISVDNLAVPAEMRGQLAARLAQKAQLRDECLALCSTHTHTAPMLKGVCPCLFGADIPPAHQERIDRYTRELADKLEKVALKALDDCGPSTLAWGQTKAGFAWNRRPQSGPVDHDVPVLVVRRQGGGIRALFFNYACHSTTMSDTPNRICGDWGGYAGEYLERDHPGAIALVALGCGADADPKPRTGLEFAKQNGKAMSTAVHRLLQQPLRPLSGKLECRTKALALPFDTLPTGDEWKARAGSSNRWVAYHAKRNIDRIARGERLPTHLSYLVQTWNFGDQLGMVFLPGEVVVDYSLRLKREFDAVRLCVTAYANDVPCYIPSNRIWKEGGYEGGDAMIYFDRPVRFAEGTEDRIVSAVRDLLPAGFLAKVKNAQSSAQTRGH